MARAPIMAAGGIVLRQASTPLIAVVRLRKRDEWVLPKGKLDAGETPRAAAEREVLEETGHGVTVHEFLGTLVYESRAGSKVVHYWRMEAREGQVHPLMKDVRAVDWLPLDRAVKRLSHGYERAFLANVGPLALQAAAMGEAVGLDAGPPKVNSALATAEIAGRRSEHSSGPALSPDRSNILIEKLRAWVRRLI